MRLEWADGWTDPRALEVESPDDLEHVLADIEQRAAGSGIATCVDIHRDGAVFSIVLGLDGVSFVQWMSGADGAYLGVDTGAAETDASDVVAFSYLGHYSEIPRSDCVPHREAMAEAQHFFVTGRLSSRWTWSGYLGDTPAPPGARVRDI